MIKITRGPLTVGPMLMASGSGGGSPGGPPKPKAPVQPKPPKPSWWQQLKAWLASKLGL